jgi:HupE/UreJ protein
LWTTIARSAPQISRPIHTRWLIIGLFGLVHGFGFSYALGHQLQFAGSHLLVSLFSFNVGIEFGQLLVLALMLPALALFRRVVAARVGVIVLSAIVAHTAWYWMTERWEVLRQAEWPRMDAAAVVSLARWVNALLLAFGAANVLAKWAGRKFLGASDCQSATWSSPQERPSHALRAGKRTHR